MIRVKDIEDNLLHLVGWRQSYDASDGLLCESLTQSESGLYYQDAHPLLTLQNLQSIAPDFKNTTYPEFSSEQSYVKGTVVKSEGKLYKALKYVPSGIDIVPDSEYWIETYPFSEWLETKTKASILRAISHYVNDRAAKGTYKVLCEKKTLFDGTGRIFDTIKNKQNLVGFEIVPVRSKGVTTKINRIGLQFTGIGAYTVFVMHSSLTEPYYAETFMKTKANSIEWFTPSIELCLPYETDEIDAGGSWYICYMQTALPAGSEAIRKNRDWSKGPCSECSRHEHETWRIWSKYIEIHPFYVNEEAVELIPAFSQDFNNDFSKQATKPYLWDIEKNVYTYDTNYGLNLDISVSCDITDFIIAQRGLFQDYLQKSLAVDFLREFAYNPNVRTNRHSINASKPDILYEIDGDSSSMKQAGMNYQLGLSLKALEVSTEGMDRVCLPCVNHGIKYRVV